MTLTSVKTAGVENVIRIHGNVKERTTEVIDLNIKANLTVSNSKGSKFVQKSLLFCVLFFTSIFTIILFNVRRELQTLKFQEQCIETKIAILMSKYEKVSNQLSRIRSHPNYNKYQPITTSYKSEIIFSSNDKPLAKYDDLSTAELLNIQNNKTRIITSPSIDQENLSHIQKDNINATVTGDNPKDDKEYSKISSMKRNQSKSSNRFIRTIINVTDENDDNQTVKYIEENFADTLSLNADRESNKITNVKKDDNIGLWSEARTARMRRDNDRRGKIRTKNKRRPNRSCRRLGPLVATFIGGIPEQHITDQGVIGPWVKLAKDTSSYDLQRFHLTEGNKSIEITMNGLYMITAQMFYFGKHTNYSYWILMNSEGKSTTQKITKCSAVANMSANEVSCHTNVVLPLRKGDRVRIQQEERDRLINLREGLSYVQLVLLSNEVDRKRRELGKSSASE